MTRIIFLLFLYSSINVSAQSRKSFFIGHSLTDNIGEMVHSLANNHPTVDFDWRFQSIPGSSLEYQFTRKLPENGYTSVPEYRYGFFHPTQGLPTGNFDDLILTESVPRHWGQYGIGRTHVDVDSFYHYFQVTNPNKQLFLYEVWHCINSGSPTGCSYDINSSPWRQRLTDDFPMWKSVIDTINTKYNPPKPMRMIPGGQGLARLNDSIVANKIPDITSINSLFADDIHLNDIGRYFIACIHFSTIHKTSPVGLTNQLYNQWGGAYTPPTPAQAAKFQAIAWEVVTDLWEVTGDNPPQVQAMVTASTVLGPAPLSVTLNGSESINNNSGILSYAWNFGDATFGIGAIVNHIFQYEGSYTVTLTVTDNNGNSDNESINIVVQSQSVGNLCEYLAYDGFAYTKNTPLHGQSGGSGFQGNWLVQGDNMDVPGLQIVNSDTSLSYSTLQTKVGHASGGRNYISSGRRLNTIASGPFIDYTLVNDLSIGASKGGKVMWVSLLINKPNDDNDEVNFELHSQDNAWCNLCGGTQRIGFGYYGSLSNVGGQKRWSLNINEVVYPSNVPMIAGNTALLFLKITFNNASTLAELFINPNAIGDNSPGIAQITQSSTSPFGFKSCSYYGGSTFNKSFIDELRIAELYRCVVPDTKMSFSNNLNFRWNGSVSSLWSNPNNWDNLQIPTSESTVTVPSTATNFPQVNINDNIKTLILQSPASLTVMPGVLLKVEQP